MVINMNYAMFCSISRGLTGSQEVVNEVVGYDSVGIG